MDTSVLTRQPDGIYTHRDTISFVALSIITVPIAAFIGFAYLHREPGQDISFIWLLLGVIALAWIMTLIRSFFPVRIDPATKTITYRWKVINFSDVSDVGVTVLSSTNPFQPKQYTVSLILNSGKKIRIAMYYRSKKVDSLVDELNALIFG